MGTLKNALVGFGLSIGLGAFGIGLFALVRTPKEYNHPEYHFNGIIGGEHVTFYEPTFANTSHLRVNRTNGLRVIYHDRIDEKGNAGTDLIWDGVDISKKMGDRGYLVDKEYDIRKNKEISVPVMELARPQADEYLEKIKHAKKLEAESISRVAARARAAESNRVDQAIKSGIDLLRKK